MLSSIKLLRKIILEYTFRRPPMPFLKSTFRETPYNIFTRLRIFFTYKRVGLWRKCLSSDLVILNLKGVTNENGEGSGRRQMLGIGLGPWSWILFYFLIWPPSRKVHISVSAHFSQIHWRWSND
jgi:hypothetical protein